MKICTKCKIAKSFNEFNKKKKSYDGLKSACRNCTIQETRSWRLKNPDADIKYRNNNKQKVKDIVVKYRQTDKGKAKHAEIEANRRAAKHMATPKWLSIEQKLEIGYIYSMAAELSWLSEGGLHVDHIVPLKGDNVCGLHVPWNLQIIPAHDNILKSNKT